MSELLQTLIDFDTQLFLSLNSHHTEFMDYFMILYSNKLVWIPFYLSFLFVMIYNFTKKNKTWFFCLLFIIVLIFLCDQISSGLLKPLVGRLRPSNLDNPISPMVHIVNGYRGGRYGFPSSHAANSFGITFFAIYLVRRNKLSVFLILWAIVTSYSRIYLGVHYPGDITVGIIIGFLSASFCYYVFQRFLGKHTHEFKPDAGPLKFDYVPILTGIASIWILFVVSGILAYYNAP